MGIKVECNVVSDFYQNGRVRKFNVDCDEPAEIGGGDRAPRPVDYLLLGLGFCQTSICLEMASILGLRLSKISASVHAELDLRGIYGIADVSPGFRNVIVRIALDTEEKDKEDLIQELIHLMQQRCPGYATFVNPTSVTTLVQINGVQWKRRESNRKS